MILLHFSYTLSLFKCIKYSKRNQFHCLYVIYPLFNYLHQPLYPGTGSWRIHSLSQPIIMQSTMHTHSFTSGTVVASPPIWMLWYSERKLKNLQENVDEHRGNMQNFTQTAQGQTWDSGTYRDAPMLPTVPGLLP